MNRALFVALGLWACSRSEPPAASAPRSSAVAAVATATPRALSCEEPRGPRPAGIPSDWRPWTCFSGCDFWTAPPDASGAAAIEWTACDSRSGATGCRQMITPWTPAHDAIAPDVFFSAEQGAPGRLLLQRLNVEGLVEWVVGHVDGPLDFAMRARPAEPSRRCFALNRDLAGGRFALSLHGDGSTGGRHVDGLLVGTVGSAAPRLAYRDEAPGTSGWSIGAERAVQNDYGRVSVLAADFSTRVPVYEPAQSAQRTPFDGRARLVGDGIVFQLADYRSSSIWAFDAAGGARPLVDFGTDGTRGAGNVGTDGRDLVWTQGENRAKEESGPYPDAAIFTAPYTTDRARLSPRRLRRDLNAGIGTALNQFAVGCGHAGRPLASGRDVEIVRLKDGTAFVLAGRDGWAWERVLGFDCKEAFLAVRIQRTRYTVARVRLDALGPAIVGE